MGMTLKIVPLLATCAALAVGTAARAHHSVAGQFDAAKRTTLTGTITKVDWINPHVYIHMDVADERGTITTWRLESLPTAMMRKAGLTSELIKAGGQKVTANAILARDGTQHLAWVLNLTYEDGHEYQLAGE
jgi:hypothetical protein